MSFHKLFLVFIVTSLMVLSVQSVCLDDILPVRPQRQATLYELQRGNCVLPPYPEYGSYSVGGIDNAVPGDVYLFLYINVTCYPGFVVEGETNALFCYNGAWSNEMPKCVRYCRLPKHESVTYICPSAAGRKSRVCGSKVPSGTIVRPVCKTPNFYYPGVLDSMTCLGGNWNYIATCKAECGKITPESTLLVTGGKSAKRGELPWHAGIYSKTTTPYMQICGGSLVSKSVVISAAHCFWSDLNKLLPATDFAVAVGKIYRPWSNPRDVDVQSSDVAEIKLTQYFQGSATNFQDDIALVIVNSPFTYQVFIRPVCLDFDELFDRQQLRDGNLGKVAGWGLVDKNGQYSQVLKVVELPFVSIEKCYATSPPSFREFITTDKICAGYTNGTALCQGDSGGGLAFAAVERGVARYFLRGVVSTAPRNEDLCSTNTLTAFTRITKHEDFIKKFVYDAIAATGAIASSDKCQSNQWQCEDGSCIDLERKCDLVEDCSDGSDETLCDTKTKPQCVLPPHPEHGTYTVVGGAQAAPGQALPSAVLNVTCDPDYELEDTRSTVSCYDGSWSDVMPKCISFCRLNDLAGVEYHCVDKPDKTRRCAGRVSSGTTVRTLCSAPLYKSAVLSDMKCVGGNWDNVPTCKPECGIPAPEGMTLVAGGRPAYKGELPWHAGIYTKYGKTYNQICGGALVTTKAVISAATCFWEWRNTTYKNMLKPVSWFGVAVNKYYRRWNDARDLNAQKSNVTKIIIPSTFAGQDDDYENDIGIAILTTPFKYEAFVRPVCLDFDVNFEAQQFRDGLGKFVGWGYDSRNGKHSPVQIVAEIPVYTEVDKCKDMSPRGFSGYVTGDKFCGGYTNGTAACTGDGGGGLYFAAGAAGEQRYFLRGVLSIVALSKGNDTCNTESISVYTQMTKHERFIKENIVFE